MTAKKAAAKPVKKAATLKHPPKVEEHEEVAAQAKAEVTQPTAEMVGEAYQVGFHGVSSDDGDYSIAAEVTRLSEA